MSETVEFLIGKNPNAHVGAKEPLLLRDPRNLYHFADVGMVAMLNDVGAIKLTAEFTDGNNHRKSTISLPRGTWLLVSVADMGAKEPGYVSYDNPFPQNNAPTRGGKRETNDPSISSGKIDISEFSIVSPIDINYPHSITTEMKPILAED